LIPIHVHLPCHSFTSFTLYEAGADVVAPVSAEDQVTS